MKHSGNGKCKVYIPEIYSEDYQYRPDMLPDAELVVGVGNGGSFSDYNIHYPNIGSMVWVFFKNDDQNYPVIFGIIPGGSYSGNAFNQTDDLGIEDDYDRRGMKEFDYRKKHPVQVQHMGACQKKLSYDGNSVEQTVRHGATSTDSPNQPYSYTMHVFNFFKTNVFQQYPLEAAYYVFDSGDYSKPKLFKVGGTDFDENKISTDNLQYDYKINDVSAVFENSINRPDCLGISCILKQTAPDEDGFKTAMWKAMFCPSARNVDIHKYGEGDGKEIWNNFDYKKTPRPNQKGIKSVFLNIDGSSRHPALDVCGACSADFYVCNGSQYGIEPAYFDKKFQNEIVYYCPKNALPPKMAPDVLKYNVNLMVIDPQRVGTTTVCTKDGKTKTESVNLYTESTFETRQEGAGDVRRIGKQQRMENPGGYSSIRGDISSYTYYEDMTSLSSDPAGLKQSVFRYYEAPQKKYVRRISCVTTENVSCGISSWHRDCLNGWKPYPPGHCIEEYISSDDSKFNPCPNTIHHDEIFRHMTRLSAGSSREEYLSTYYNWSKSPCHGISSHIWHDVADPENPTLHLSAAWSDYKSKQLKYVQFKLFGKDGYLSVVATDDFDMRVQWYPDIPGDWQKNETDFSHVHMTKTGSVKIDCTTDLDVEVSPLACPKALKHKPSPKSHFYLSKTGDITIDSTNSITLKSPTINMLGQTLNQTFDATANMKTGVNNIDANVINEQASVKNLVADANNVTGQTTHTGNVEVGGNVVASGTVKDSGCTLATHVHAFTCPDGGGTTEAGTG